MRGDSVYNKGKIKLQVIWYENVDFSNLKSNGLQNAAGLVERALNYI